MAGLGHGKWEMDGSGNDGKHGKFFPGDHEEIVVVCQHFVLGVLMAFASNFPSFKFVKIASGLIKPLVARCPGSGHFTISRSLWIPSRPNRRRSGPRENLHRKLWRLPKKPEGSWKNILPSGKQPHSYGKITIFNGKTHYKSPFSIAFSMFTRPAIPLNSGIPSYPAGDGSSFATPWDSTWSHCCPSHPSGPWNGEVIMKNDCLRKRVHRSILKKKPSSKLT